MSHSPKHLIPAKAGTRNTTQAPGGGRAFGFANKPAMLVFLVWSIFQTSCGLCSDPPPLTENQVKALFLLNFTKYVDWPPEAFLQPDSDFQIGVFGPSSFTDELRKAVQGKTVGRRRIVVQQLDAPKAAGSQCQMIFIGAGEKKRAPEILAQLNRRPVLTVGEMDQFTQLGGIINFTKKEGKIRLEVDLDTAKAAGLEISSRLLNVADVVRGKP